MSKKEEKYCGSCCWFKFEDIDGWGQCQHQKSTGIMHCSDMCTTERFVSEAQKRHYMAVLLQANRYRRDGHVPALHRMPNPTELGKAIDFAYLYMKSL